MLLLLRQVILCGKGSSRLSKFNALYCSSVRLYPQAGQSWWLETGKGWEEESLGSFLL